jgi:hypothetical protein
MDVEDPMAMKSRTEAFAPKRAVERTLTLDPNVAKLIMDILAEKRTTLRTDTLEARLAISTTDSLDTRPTSSTPFADKAEPRRLKLRIEMELPR